MLCDTVHISVNGPGGGLRHHCAAASLRSAQCQNQNLQNQKSRPPAAGACATATRRSARVPQCHINNKKRPFPKDSPPAKRFASGEESWFFPLEILVPFSILAGLCSVFSTEPGAWLVCAGFFKTDLVFLLLVLRRLMSCLPGAAHGVF